MDFQVNLNICRVCMKSRDGQSLMRGDLHRKFEFATRLELNPHDNMPKNICTNCVARLKEAYDFIQLAHTSEENLKAFLTKINNDFQLVTQANPADNSVEQQPEETEEEEDENNVLIFLDKETPIENASSTTLNNTEQFICSKKARKSLLVPVKNNVSRSFLMRDSDEQAETQKCATTIRVDECTEVTGGDFLVFDSEGSESIKTTTEANFNIKEVYMSEMPEPEEAGSDTEMEVLEEVLPLATETTDCLPTNMELQSPQGNDLKEFVVMMSDNEEESNSGSTCIKEEILWVKETVDENSVEELHIYEDTEDPQEPGECTTESLEFIPETDAVVVYNENSNSIEAELKSKPQSSTTKPSKPSKAKKQSPALVDNTRFYCLKCNRDFSTKTNLTRHMVTHDGTRPYVCKICGNSFTQNGTLKQHMYTHTGEKPFVCKYCDRGFTQCKSLVFHMRRHTGDKPFHCEHCELFFRQKDGLKVHILKHHMITKQNGDSQTHTCIICKMVLSTKDELLVHMKKHLNTTRPNSNKNGNADIILELMEESDLLDDKQLIKEDDGNGADDEELSQQIDGLASQVVDIASSSTDEPRRVKKYLCRKCYKCFAIKKNLIRHLSIHDMSVSELFQCETCEIAFDTSYALKTHCLREHKEPKSNQSNQPNCSVCGECNVDFLTVDKLNEHMVSMHSDLDYICPICDNLKFDSEKLLIDHMMLMHELTDGEEATGDSGDGGS